MTDGWSDSQTFCIWKRLEMVKEWDFAMTDGMGIMLFFLISKKKYIKRTSRKQEANERVQRGAQTKRKHKRKQKADRANKN